MTRVAGTPTASSSATPRSSSANSDAQGHAIAALCNLATGKEARAKIAEGNGTEALILLTNGPATWMRAQAVEILQHMNCKVAPAETTAKAAREEAASHMWHQHQEYEREQRQHVQMLAIARRAGTSRPGMGSGPNLKELLSKSMLEGGRPARGAKHAKSSLKLAVGEGGNFDVSEDGAPSALLREVIEVNPKQALRIKRAPSIKHARTGPSGQPAEPSAAFGTFKVPQPSQRGNGNGGTTSRSGAITNRSGAITNRSGASGAITKRGPSSPGGTRTTVLAAPLRVGRSSAR